MRIRPHARPPTLSLAQAVRDSGAARLSRVLVRYDDGEEEWATLPSADVELIRTDDADPTDTTDPTPSPSASVWSLSADDSTSPVCERRMRSQAAALTPKRATMVRTFSDPTPMPTIPSRIIPRRQPTALSLSTPTPTDLNAVNFAGAAVRASPRRCGAVRTLGDEGSASSSCKRAREEETVTVRPSRAPAAASSSSWTVPPEWRALNLNEGGGAEQLAFMQVLDRKLVPGASAYVFWGKKLFAAKVLKLDLSQLPVYKP